MGPLPPPSRLWVAVGSWDVAFDVVEFPLDELLLFDEELELLELEAEVLVRVDDWVWPLEELEFDCRNDIRDRSLQGISRGRRRSRART